MSTFSGLNAATSALFAQQRGLDVTGQNIANVNTEGYSRQRAELRSVGGATVPAVFSVSNQVGQGVSADTVIRIRDAFLEGRGQAEHASTASLTVTQGTLAQIEDAFREPGDTGLQSQLDDMWAGWADLAKETDQQGSGARAQVLERTRTVVDSMHTTSKTLDQQWMQTRDNLGTMVDQVNATATTIADLNQAIKRGMAGGLPVNELADKRDVLVMQLSEQVGATSALRDDGTMTVSVPGATLVDGTSTIKLQLVGAHTQAEAAGDPPRIITAPGGTTIRPSGTAEGDIKAMTDLIPRYQASLDAIARQLAGQLNTAHQSGYDTTGAAGTPLLDDGTGTGYAAVDPSTITASNIRLRVTDVSQLAAASIPTTATGGVVSTDRGNASAMYQLRLSTTGADANYRKMIVGLGVEASVATSNMNTQSVISTQVDGARESTSGVSIDEEMTNMLQYQHAYSAAAKLVTAIDETLQTLLNMVGH